MAVFPIPKGFQRLGAFPLDASTIYSTLAELETYASSGTAHAGQICAVVDTATTVYKINPDMSVSEIGSGGTGSGIAIFSSFFDLTAYAAGGADNSTDAEAGQVVSLNNGSDVFVFKINPDWSVTEIGLQGLPGVDGTPGADGVDGYTPIKGVDYFDGSPGSDGVDGANAVCFRIILEDTSSQIMMVRSGSVNVYDSSGTLHVVSLLSDGEIPFQMTDGTVNNVLPVSNIFENSSTVMLSGDTDEILVGGGGGNNPVWTVATGSGSPVRADSPTLTNVTANTILVTDFAQMYVDKGDSGASTVTFDYSQGAHQRVKVTGDATLAISNWPDSGWLGEFSIELVHDGTVRNITWPSINWIKSDGSTTTTFASNGVTLQSANNTIDWVILWSRDGGTTMYGKIIR